MKHIFDKFLPAFGIGSATVETRLSDSEVTAGSTLYGEVCIHGGKTEQDIKDIVLILKAEYVQRAHEKPSLRQVEDLAKLRVAQNLTIKPKQELCLPFQLDIPLSTPISFFEQTVWLHTDLDVLWAVTSEDRDYIDILPHPYMKKILTTLDGPMDFVLKTVEIKDFQYVSKTPDYTQIFVYLPQGLWHKYCQKLKVWFTFLPQGIQVSFNKIKLDGATEKYMIFFDETILSVDEHQVAETLAQLIFPEHKGCHPLQNPALLRKQPPS